MQTLTIIEEKVEHYGPFPPPDAAIMPRCISILLASFFLVGTDASSSSFDPYQLNGGLVTAVAGKDYVVMATDTRMMGAGGYDILERTHLRSRLWTVRPLRNPRQTSNGDTNGLTNTQLATAAQPTFPTSSVDLISEQQQQQRDSTVLSSDESPVLVGSAGCNADCEMLKRVVQADLRAARYFGESTANQVSCFHVASVLSQILYSRRTFPFYSFCVVGGLEPTTHTGSVFVYDAIGSYEQVAVAAVGTGRELLQPILDRQFRSTESPAVEAGSTTAALQRPHVTSAVGKQVSASVEETVSILTNAYRSASERDIGVGDQLVICIVQRKDESSPYTCDFRTLPLKKH